VFVAFAAGGRKSVCVSTFYDIPRIKYKKFVGSVTDSRGGIALSVSMVRKVFPKIRSLVWLESCGFCPRSS
jgi:pyruvate-formate lyase-activating enzyme